MKTETGSPGEAPRPYEIRELRSEDLGNGFLEALGSLSDVEGLPLEEARRILAEMKRAPLYHVFVAVSADGQVIGATTLLVEQKFIHHGGLVGHIEDVVVRKDYQGRGVGGPLVKAGIKKAEELGCYKVVLDCKDELVGFYEKLGFSRRDVGMRIDLKTKSSTKALM
jgi:glucosamine-phosphate N-acetyltransferase